MMSANIECSFT